MLFMAKFIEVTSRKNHGKTLINIDSIRNISDVNPNGSEIQIGDTIYVETYEDYLTIVEMLKTLGVSIV